MKLLSFLPIAQCCLAATSIVLPPGKTGTAAYPGFPSTASIRVEGRIHGITYANAYSHAWYLTSQLNTLRLSAVGSNTSLWGIIQNNNQITNQNPPTDFEFRWQRTASGRRIFEVWNIADPATTVFYANDTAVTPALIAAGNILIGEVAAGASTFKLAYLRIFENSPMAMGGLPPGASGTPGNFANYEFEGSSAAELGADTSGNGRNLTWSGGTAPTPELTPPLPPVCNPGTSKTFRAGGLVTMDGSNSWGMGGVPLLYMWTLTDQPSEPRVQSIQTVVPARGGRPHYHDGRLYYDKYLSEAGAVCDTNSVTAGPCYRMYQSNLDGSNEFCINCDDITQKHTGTPVWDPLGRGIFYVKQRTDSTVTTGTPGQGIDAEIFFCQAYNTSTHTCAERLQILAIPAAGAGHGILHPQVSSDGGWLLWGQKVPAVCPPPGCEYGKFDVKIAPISWVGTTPTLGTITTFTPSGPWHETHQWVPCSPGGAPDRCVLLSIGGEATKSANQMDVAIFRVRSEAGTVLANCTGSVACGNRLVNLSGNTTDWDEHIQLSPSGNKYIWAKGPLATSGAFPVTDWWQMNLDGSEKVRLTYFNASADPPAAQVRILSQLGFIDNSRFVGLAQKISDYTDEIVTVNLGTASQVHFVNNINTGSPAISIENAIAGQYSFRLLVSDGASLSSCTVSHGVVPATTSGVVIPDLSTPEKAKFHELLGPVAAFYKLQEVWPYAATVATYMEQYFRTLPGPNWEVNPPFWENPAYLKPGTITLTVGSTTVTGVGTSLQTLICNGGTTPVVIAPATGSARFITYRYPSSDGGFNWNYQQVASCQSETQVTLGAAFAAQTDGTGVYSGMAYYTETNFFSEVPSGQWTGTQAAASSNNFYDRALASYGHHVATGLTAPLTHARLLAEAWIKAPAAGRRGYGVRAPRDMALTGMVLRYLEDTSNTWILTALNNFWDQMIQYSNPGTPGIGEREQYYNQMFLAECNLVNPTKCTSAFLTSEFTRLWKASQCTGGLLHTWGKDCLNNWGQYSISSVRAGGPGGTTQGDSSFPTAPTDIQGNPYYNSRIAVNTGSPRVTLTGATWPVGYWDYNDQNIRAFWVKSDNNTVTNEYPWGFRNDRVSGAQGTFTYISPTEVDLPTPWLGPNLTGRYWQYYSYPGQYTNQPFITGIGGAALWRLHRSVGIPDSHTIMMDQVNYIIDYGYNPAQKGLYYMRASLNCETITGGIEGCASSQSTGRFNNGETTRALAYAYMSTGNTYYRDWGDKLVGPIFGDFSCYPNCGPQTDQFGNDDIKPPGGATYTSQRAKDYGFLFGMGGVLTQTAMRTGITAWPMVPVTATVQQSFRLADIPGSDRVAITLKDQRGVVGTPTVCLTSPCAITIPDRSAGNYQMQIAYRTGSTTRATGLWQQLKNVE